MSYLEGCRRAKRVREGIVEQRPTARAKKKRLPKPWAVFLSWGFTRGSKFVAVREFAKEEEAIRFADKERRMWNHIQSDRVWVANNGEDRQRT